MINKIIDCHAHLDEITDIPGVVDRAVKAGLQGVILVGVDLKSNVKNIGIAKENAAAALKMHLAMGVHPDNVRVNETEEAIELIRKNAAQIVAVGEIGLDYGEDLIDDKAKNIQKEYLSIQLNMAKELDKPVILHSRKAWVDCFEIVKSLGTEKAVFHWYSGPLDILKKILDAGYYVSLTPAIDGSHGQLRTAKYTPLDRVLVETDTPVRYRTKDKQYIESEPKDTVKVVEKLAEVKGMSFDEIAGITTKNAKRFFNL